MAQNQNPGQGNPMGGAQGNLLSQLTGGAGAGPPKPYQAQLGSMFGGQQPMQGAGPGGPMPPQGAPGQGPGGAKGGMQKQIAGLQGGPQPMSGPNPAMGANLAQWAAQRGPKNPNAPQPNISNMPGVGQTMPAGWQKMQGGGGQPPPGGAPGMMPDLMGQQNLAAKNLRPQGAPGQGPGGGKPQAMKQQMATLPGGPR